MKRIDLTGQKIGLLTVVGYSHSHIFPSGQKAAMWNVVCDCGVAKQISSSNLATSRSCGCLVKAGLGKKPFGVASFNLKFNQYKAGAKRRNIKFALTKEQFLQIVKQPCFYCGAIDSTTTQGKRCHGHFQSNGIDRIDSRQEYCLANCVACCPTCNKMKMDLPQDQFFAHMKKILQHTQTS